MMHVLFTVALCLGSALGQTTPKPTMALNDLDTELQSRGQFSTLLDLINTAGLMSALKSANHMTLFAPTDAAFAQLPAGSVDALKGNAAQLKDLLGYHAVLDEEFKIKRGHVQDTELTASNGQPIRINSYNVLHTVSAEGVNITERDIHVTNGFVHVLESPLTPPEGDVVDLVTTRPDTSTLASVLTSAGLVDAVRADHNMTLFAPSNDAFKKVSPEIMQYLSSHPKDLKEVLLYHLVARGTYYSIGMKHGVTLRSADHGHDALVVLEDDAGNVFINSAKVTEVDESVTNGVVHIIDKVLIPTHVLVHIEDQGLTIG